MNIDYIIILYYLLRIYIGKSLRKSKRRKRNFILKLSDLTIDRDDNY